jgi:NADPH-dependent glutamate synthase beta subunit-like oxidoreductase
MGVIFKTGVKVDDVASALEQKKFDAALLAIGAGASKHVDIPANTVGKFIDAVAFLREAAEGQHGAEELKIGRRVAIYGGGNTAMDAARVAKRLGAEETVIIYRRDRRHAPAHQDEIQEAIDEGVVVHWLRTIKEVDNDDLKVEIMKLNSKGQPEPTGEFETLQADTVILAVGQDPESSWLSKVPGLKFQSDGSIEVNDKMMTGYPGLFAGGDLIPAKRTVTVAVGHGKKAARNMDAYLRGDQYVKPPRPAVATPDKLNLWYYSDAPKSIQPTLDNLRRMASFDETVGGLDENTALYEARRCLSCGNCLACDNCYGVCPDNAIIKLAPGKYAVNTDYCKGCGICAKECPCGCLRMVVDTK